MRVPWRRRAAAVESTSTSGPVPGNPLLDVPESDPARDRLGRADFARRLAQTLSEPVRTAPVVGLYAPYGEGKTTVLRYVEHYLRSGQPGVIPVWFVPWFDTGDSQIIAQFYAAIAGALGHKLRRARDLVKPALKVGGDLAGAIPMVNLAPAVKAADNVVKDPTLRNLHDRLAKMLHKEQTSRGRRLVVLIDDVDRLEADQLAMVFRMIKLAADFPSLVVLAAFDPDRVAPQPGAKFGTGGANGPAEGRAFLEKIVPVQVTMPPTDPARLARLMHGLLLQVMNEHSTLLASDDMSRLLGALTHVWPQLATLRQGKVLLQKLAFALPVMRGEINPCDQIMGLRP